MPPSMNRRPSRRTGRNTAGMAAEAANAEVQIAAVEHRHGVAVVIRRGDLQRNVQAPRRRPALVRAGRRFEDALDVELRHADAARHQLAEAARPGAPHARRHLGPAAKDRARIVVDVTPGHAGGHAAPMMAPIEEPAIDTGRMPSSSSASMTWICASPRAPPPPKAMAKVGSGPGGGRGFGSAPVVIPCLHRSGRADDHHRRLRRQQAFGPRP